MRCSDPRHDTDSDGGSGAGGAAPADRVGGRRDAEPGSVTPITSKRAELTGDDDDQAA